MYTTLLLSGLLSTVFAAPLVSRQSDWQPTEGTLATCDATSDKFLSLVIGPEQGDVIFDHACAGILPACAYPENLPEGTVCTQTIDYRIDGPKNVTLNALVEDKATRNKLSQWAANFAFTPAQQPEGSAGVFLSKDECKGYFTNLLMKSGDEGCWFENLGPSAGSLTVGGTSSLKNAVFTLSFVPRK